MSEFPPAGLSTKEDNQFYGYSVKDNTVRQETEGGYAATRPRSRIRPKRMWTTGFGLLKDSDLRIINEFYDARRGGADSFTWRDPVTNVEYTVRFVGNFEPQYQGMGGQHLWTLQVKLEEI